MRSSKIGIDRLVALIDYVEATERDRLRTVLDMVDYRGFRRFGDDLIKLPGVLVNVRDADDHCWLTVERLVRCPPPAPDDAELRVWIDLPDEVDTPPSLRREVPRALLGVSDAQPPAAETIALDGFEGRARLETAIEGYRRERWSRWAEEERPRRQSIELYNGLFALRQSLEGGSEQPVELVWGIGIARWTRAGTKLHHPLVTVPVEISLSERTHAIEVRPRSEAPVAIESGPMDALGVASAEDWRSGAQRYFDGLEGDGVTPFATESFAPVLRRAVAVLDPDGAYLPELGERQPPVGDTLRVDDGWVLLERTRQGTQLMDDLRSLRGQVSALDDVSELPAAVRALIEDPTDAAVAEAYPALRGVSTIPGVTSSDGSGEDLFFPKPFNREQVEVIQRLSTRAGVVVQGPPGTGKTHTIANIISHYLALGKRVLVTSQKAPPLKVLREKLPEAVRPLAVSLLESDRDGLKQFQESVDIIADRVQRTRPADAARQIAALDARIEALHRGLAVIDRQIDEIGRGAMAPAVLDGAPIEPADAARRLLSAGTAADWIADPIDVIASHEPEFDDEAIAALRTARRSVMGRIADLDHAVPDAALPDVDALVLLHRSLISADEIERTTTGVAAVSPGTSLDAIAALRTELESLRAARSDVSGDAREWTLPVMARWRSDPDDPALLGLEGLRGDVGELCDLARHFLVRPVTLFDGAADDRDFRDAVRTLASGEDLGLFQSLFARQLKQQVGSVRLSGRAPADASQWTEVVRYLSALDRTVALGAAWNNAAPHAGLDTVPVDGPSAGELMRRQLDHVGRLREVVRRERSAESAVHAMLPGSGRHHPVSDAGIDALLELLDRHLRLSRLSEARADRTRLVQSLSGIEGALGEELREILGTMVGHGGTDATLLARRWAAALSEADALRALAPAFSRIRHVCSLIEESGAPQWAELLRRQPVEGLEDPLTPGDWRERWTLRRLATWLGRIDRHDRLRALGADRRDHEDRLRRAYEEAIEQRTWCRLAEKASDQVRAALAAYAQAMRRLGRGTGVRAGRYRADARAAADRAKNALPCWIMPHYRVSESLPAELGLFDLVIIDEASQSTMAALPALLRAKQVLIVGDDRQVSPDAGFREEARMNLLADRHLGGQVSDYRSALREEKSLYDLGTVVFAGGAIMLKEHFRCVAPIIEYSKAQFYSHQLEPLRLPSASERLDPPLVDIMVEDGYRKGKVNPPEVDCIVDAISRISDDPAMKGRSIGVTTLLGQEQAVAIQTAIEQVLGTEIMLRHDIRVGEPVAFQGDERDIMFISLVADRGSSGLSGLGYEQRFNVAASRARDRMVLVRSVELEDLRPSDRLRRSLIEHFHAPFAGDGALSADRRTRCESPFETDMYDLLVERGFRVDTQVAVGSKRIDLVVEGSNDRRLAIECDGDRYHGPEQWPDDMARQRMLERAGWVVWRCFASRFLRDRRGVMDELVEVLAARGIHPETGDALPPSRHTEHRRWRSLPLDAEHVPYAWLVVEDAA
ncbi:AAA domain-containing protein [Sphingomonas sp. PvP018]|uniref:AAA domain-containing protein n=1 Tax=Sphingomonas sp. PvP018 TaxID=2817852 RepID=UPI001AEA73C8|nr:AAA domain-containing protein [Sphingomonas sp. PvP018]MBP2513800.1 very-short-patch-repair endonuclease [Sphingomonas sp. PvP018]